MLTVDALRGWGANVKEGMARCLNKEDFYLRLVGMSLADSSFEKLDAAIASGDVEKAFDAAHNLKGATGNLSLTPVYNPICDITEALRGQKTMPDISAAHGRLTAALSELRELAK